MRPCWLLGLALLTGCAERSFLHDSRTIEQQQAEEQALSDADALRELREESQRPPEDSSSEVDSAERSLATP